MADIDRETLVQAHKELGPKLYMRVWELLDKTDRTPEETDEMLLAVHTSAYHWGQLKGELDEDRWEHSFAIAHNQIACVYVDLGDAQMALYHATRCMDYFEKYGEGGFPVAYGYECLARAQHLAGDVDARDKAIRNAIEAGNTIDNEQFRNAFFEALETVPGYDVMRSGS